MKKLFFLAALLCTALAGCEYDDSNVQERLDGLEDRVAALEKAVNTLNTNVSTLQSFVDGKLFITSVTENPEGGGYTLSLVTSNGEASEIVIKDGEDGAAPVVGVKLDTDGKYYWTLDGEFIKEDGKKIPVTGDDGVTPVFKIENDTWYVSYDKEVTWKECGRATGADGDAFFKKVELSEDGRYVHLTLADGQTVLTLELYTGFGIAFESGSGFVSPGGKIDIPFVLTGADDKTVVETIAKGNWEAEVVMDGTTGGKIAVTAPAESSTGRVIVLLSDGASKTIMKTLTFVSGVMNVSTQSQEAAAAGGTVNFELQTDVDFEVVIPDEVKGWISRIETRALRDETLTFDVKANDTGEDRTAKIELTCAGTVVETLLIYQMPDFDPAAFVAKVAVTDKMANTLILPLDGMVNATVAWGDGTTDAVTEVRPQHVYEKAGEYYVAVTGTVTGLGNRLTKTSQSAIVRVVQWGQLGLESLAEAFYNNKGLTQVAVPAEGAFAKVTTTDDMFYNCTLLEEIPVGLIDRCTELTTVESMFSGCTALTSIPAGFFDKCPKITSVASVFKGCKKVTEIPAGLFDLLPEVTDLSSVFYGTGITTVPDGIFNKQTKATALGSAFYGCTALTTVPEDLFASQTEVTSIVSLFKGCTALESIPAGLFDPFTKITSMSSLFSGCTLLGNLPAGLFDKVGSNMAADGKLDVSYLFENCKKMTDFPTLANLPRVTNVAAFWKGCTALTTVPADYFPADCEAAISVANMFNGCTSLKTLPAGLLKSCTGITISSNMFQSCTSLETLPEGLFDAMSKCTNIKEMFKGCTSLESLPATLFDKMTSINATASAFYGCTAFTGESPYMTVEVEGKQVKVHLYDRVDYKDLFEKVPDSAVNSGRDVKDCFKNCTKMADYAIAPIAWGGTGDGTTAAPTITLSHAAPVGLEYHAIDFTVKGTEFKSGKYIIGTTQLVQSVLDEFDGDMVKATNKYGIAFSATQLKELMSETGLVLDFHNLEPQTEYTLLVRGNNVHGTIFETAVVTTAARPQGSAEYERYIGTWTVTTTSSEVTKQPQTYTIRIEPYRNDVSYRVYDWGATFLGSGKPAAGEEAEVDPYPFYMTYKGDGSVEINSFDDLGMYGWSSYVYIRYRFLNQQSQPLIWITRDPLVKGTYDTASNEITITCDTFNDTEGITHQITGFDYVLYSSSVGYYEAKNLIKPGYLIDDSKVDYGVGPYKLTKAAAATSASVKKSAAKFESLRPTEAKAPAAAPAGIHRLSMMSVH